MIELTPDLLKARLDAFYGKPDTAPGWLPCRCGRWFPSALLLSAHLKRAKRWRDGRPHGWRD